LEKIPPRKISPLTIGTLLCNESSPDATIDSCLHRNTLPIIMNSQFKGAIRAAVFTVCLNAGITSANAASTVLYGNFGTVNSSTTSNTVGYLSNSQQNQFQAQGFTMGSTDFELTSLEFGLGSTGSPAPQVQIYGDNSGSPGSALAIFTLTSGPVSTKGSYNFNGSFVAQQNTKYWAVVSDANFASLESFEWYTNDSFTTPSGKNASGIAYLGTKERNNVGGTWTDAIPSLSIGISGTAVVPEPSALALFGLATVGFAARRRRVG
jgi:hypothetical protein